MRQIRTDLAVELSEIAGKIDGVETEELTHRGLSLTRVTVKTPAAALKLGKAKGQYLTAQLPRLWSYDYTAFTECVDVLGNELKSLLNLDGDESVLVVGLGNDRITPDALGPLAVRSTMVTRHLKERMPEWFQQAELRRVAAVSPNVLGNTGIETAEIVRGICDRIKPDRVIVVDALAARRLARLTSTVQLADTGISPGSGVANRRSELSESTLGVPVVSVGVPTVVDAATLASDVVEQTEELLRRQTGKEGASILSGLPSEEKTQLFSEVLAPDDQNLMVTPKDIDRVIGEVSKMVGFAINTALHKDISVDEMAKFTLS